MDGEENILKFILSVLFLISRSLRWVNLKFMLHTETHIHLADSQKTKLRAVNIVS